MHEVFNKNSIRRFRPDEGNHSWLLAYEVEKEEYLHATWSVSYCVARCIAIEHTPMYFSKEYNSTFYFTAAKHYWE